jgi:hypothetical protein
VRWIGVHRFVLLAALVACSSPSRERTYALDELDVQRFTLGLPVDGDGKLVVSESLVAVTDWSAARGHATFDCDGCTLGDDRATVPGFWGSDVPFGHVTFDTVAARVDFADGRMHATSQWHSPDFELVGKLDGTLAKQNDDIELQGCIKFRPTDELLARDPKLYAVFSTTGAERDNAGWFAIAIEGRIGDLKRFARRCEP